MQSAIPVFAIGLLSIVAYGDVCTRRIPNALCLGIAVLGAFRIALTGDVTAAGYTLTVAAAVFAAFCLLFWQGAIGGGDVKLVTAMVLLVGHREVFGFLALMSLFGCVLALAIIARDTLCPHFVRLRQPACTRPPIPIAELQPRSARSSIPYGVAIAAAGVVTLIPAR